MAFLAPLFLIGMAAAAIPIALHLLRRRAEPVIEFAAMRYLKRVPVEQSRVGHLRELLLLALRVAAVVLCALAFARPYFPQAAGTSTAPATVVLIDTSASLSAPGQFERARARAHDVIRSAPAAHAVALVAFGAGSDVLAPLSSDRASAHAAVDALEAGAGATQYDTALARGTEVLEGRPGRLVMITDLQASGLQGHSPVVPERVDVAIEDVGTPAGNVAVTALRRVGADALAVVQNYSPDAVREQVVFTVDGRSAGTVVVSIAGGGTAEARVNLGTLTEDQPAALRAAVTDSQGYAADNARYAVFDPIALPSVLAVTADPAEAFFLERALTVADRTGGFRFASRGGQAFSSMTAEALDEFDVIVILGTRGIERARRGFLADYVRSGGGLLLTAGPSVDPAVLTAALNGVVETTWRAPSDGALAFAPSDSRHPIFRTFGGVATLGNVTFTRSVSVKAAHTAAILARYSDGSPALVEEQIGAGRVLVLGSDLNDRWNDFPVQPTFVPFIHETLRYLAASRSRKSDYLVGELAGADGATPGIVTLGATSAGRAQRRAAINVDPHESNPARITVEAFLSGVVRRDPTTTAGSAAPARNPEDGQRLWQMALLLMIVSLGAEGMLARAAR